jgi:cell wall-associated NlpC family hydrolase
VPGWQKQLLAAVGAPTTPQNLLFVNDWQRAEGGGAANNPFNTTQPSAGATSYNKVGVRNYGSPQQGLAATAATLKNGRYGDILDALHQGTSARAAAAALAASPWGTGSLVEQMLGAGAAPPPPASAGASLATAAAAPAQPQVDLGALRSQLLGKLSTSTSSGAGDLTGFYGAVGQARQVRAQAAADAKTPQVQDVSHVGATKAQQLAATLPRSQVGGAIARTALSQIGIPYQWGGAAKLGSRTDCSGLLQASAAAHDVHIGRTTYEQWKQGIPVALDQVQPGDGIFFHMGKNGPEHVAIYIGNGQVVEDPHTGAAVEISKLAGRGAVGARRFG